jgi:coproporphyrinogen III oxidase-like Fe-S oxidoreductase
VLEEEGLEVTARGMLLIRAVAMVFDEYLQRTETERNFSQVI